MCAHTYIYWHRNIYMHVFVCDSCTNIMKALKNYTHTHIDISQAYFRGFTNVKNCCIANNKRKKMRIIIKHILFAVYVCVCEFAFFCLFVCLFMQHMQMIMMMLVLLQFNFFFYILILLVINVVVVVCFAFLWC